jgi:hypothetical protein
VLTSLVTALLATGIDRAALETAAKEAPLRVLGRLQVQGVDGKLRPLLRVLLGLCVSCDDALLIAARACLRRADQPGHGAARGEHGAVLTVLNTALFATGMTRKVLSKAFEGKDSSAVAALRVLAEVQVDTVGPKLVRRGRARG